MRCSFKLVKGNIFIESAIIEPEILNNLPLKFETYVLNKKGGRY